jgi:Novel toxin 16
MKLPKLTAEMGLCSRQSGRNNQTNQASTINFRSIPFTSGITLSNVGDCTDAEHADLQAKVDYYCHNALSCTVGLSCDELLDRGGQFLACNRARKNINKTCFRGGDAGHKQAANDAKTAADKCADFWESYCIGPPSQNLVDIDTF